MRYITVKGKFFVALFIACLWLIFCTYFSIIWIKDLAEYIGYFFSIVIIALIALIPGFMNAFLLTAYFIDRRPKNKKITQWPNISVLVPAFNEEENIAQTIESILRQDYPGNIEIIAINNNSIDHTLNILNDLKTKADNLIVLTEQKAGKANALNAGLARATHDYIITLDADTYVLANGFKELMAKFLSDTPNTASVAGSIYVRNSRENFMTKMQEYDYFHSIAAIKRMQSLFQGTLVAQGAFSLYKKSCIEEVGGWKDTVGEDIVLTWGLLEKGYRVDFAENAITFTTVPRTYRGFYLQRRRWSRGMIEAFVAHPKVLLLPRLTTFLIYWNLLFPAIDSCYFFIFIPGIIAAFFGYYFIAGPMTLLVLPLALIVNLCFFHGQKKMFTQNNLKVRQNYLGLITYMLVFYLIMVPACIHGYFLEIFSSRKIWGDHKQ